MKLKNNTIQHVPPQEAGCITLIYAIAIVVILLTIFSLIYDNM